MSPGSKHARLKEAYPIFGTGIILPAGSIGEAQLSLGYGERWFVKFKQLPYGIEIYADKLELFDTEPDTN